jgi:single-strand DNA-binding protein
VAGLNKIILVGTLVNDAETHFAVEGTARANFKLGVRTFSSGAASLMNVDVVIWGKLAESCAKLLKSGRMVLAEGSLHIRSFEDQSGNRKWTTEVVASNLQMLDQKAAATVQSAAPTPTEEEVPDLPEGDLPF